MTGSARYDMEMQKRATVRFSALQRCYGIRIFNLHSASVALACMSYGVLKFNSSARIHANVKFK